MASSALVPNDLCRLLKPCERRVTRHNCSQAPHSGARTFIHNTVGSDKHRSMFQSAQAYQPNFSLRCLNDHARESQAADTALQMAPGVEAAEQRSQVDTHAVHQAASVYQPASLSRVFIGVQPGRGLARQITKVGKPSGPMSLMLLLFTLAGTISAAVRQRFEAAARECTTCRGFGINRCTLCSGSGAVGWEGKWDHKEPCPMCLGKRFVDCPECGGHFHRRIFNHHHHTGLTVTELVEAEQTTVSKLGD